MKMKSLCTMLLVLAMLAFAGLAQAQDVADNPSGEDVLNEVPEGAIDGKINPDAAVLPEPMKKVDPGLTLNAQETAANKVRIKLNEVLPELLKLEYAVDNNLNQVAFGPVVKKSIAQAREIANRLVAIQAKVDKMTGVAKQTAQEMIDAAVSKLSDEFKEMLAGKDEQIADLQAKLAANAELISTNSGDIKLLQAQVGALETYVFGLQGMTQELVLEQQGHGYTKITLAGNRELDARWIMGSRMKSMPGEVYPVTVVARVEAGNYVVAGTGLATRFADRVAVNYVQIPFAVSALPAFAEFWNVCPTQMQFLKKGTEYSRNYDAKQR